MRGRNEVEPKLASNGAGKSTVWKALCWCIYGKTPEGLKNPDVKGWGNKAVPEVTLELSIDDEAHTIIRRAVSNGLSIDGKEVGPEEAEKLIGLSFEVFTNTILLAQGQPLFFDLAPKEKLQLFTEVLQLERWERRSEQASSKVKELNQIEAEISGELLGVESAISRNTTHQERTKQESEDWEAAKQERLSKREDDLKDAEKRLKPLQNNLDLADRAYDSAMAELKALRKDQDKYSKACQDADRKLSEATAALNQLRRERDKLQHELTEVGDECPTCGQSLTGTNLQKHQKVVKKQLADLNKQIEEGVDPELIKASVEASKQRQRHETSVSEFTEKAEKAQDDLQFLRPEVATLTTTIANLKSARKEQKEERNPYTNVLGDLRKEANKLSTQKEELLADQVKAKQQIERYKFWVKGFKDVQLYVIEEVLAELELVTASTLAEVGLVDWAVKYSIEKETKAGTIKQGLNVEIIAPTHKQSARWESWSGGEGQRLRLIGALALSQVLLNYSGLETNLEVLDEPTRGLSASGVADLCSFLKDRAGALNRQCWLVDHMAREGGVFNSVITVVKTPKGSIFEGLN